jgi:hypothetical protein
MMPVWMTIDNDSTPDRVTTALSFVTNGRAVAFPGFSLAVADDTLRVDVDYPTPEQRDDALARRLIDAANRNLDSLFEAHPEHSARLSALPRAVAIVYSYGTGDVEIAKLHAGRLIWARKARGSKQGG